MFIYSGKSRLCNCGVETKLVDDKGNALNTGDIVMIYTIDSFGVASLNSLSVVVSDQWQSYSDGIHKLKDGEPEYFIMGIKNVVLNEESPSCSDISWRVRSLKKFSDVIDGEGWSDFGFSYSDK